MRPFLAICSCILLLTGCATSTINVLEKKDTPRPFSKIMAIYIDGDIDFALFDSLTYNICLRSSFIDTASREARVNTEEMLSDGLSSPRTAVIHASDFFGQDFNSYSDFTREMDTLGVDAVLLIHIHQYTYTPHKLPDLTYPLASIGPITSSVGVENTFLTPNAAFACYLIKPHEFLPVWKAEVDVKGKGYNGKRVLKSSMIGQLEKILVTTGYIAPHRTTDQ